MDNKSIEKLKSFVNYKTNKHETSEYFMKKEYFNEFVINEHDKGHRPIDYIEQDYFEELELNTSLSFFKWYLINYCEPCETYIAYDTKPLEFYDIVKCAEELKKQNINELKKEYSNYNNANENNTNTYFFAEIEFYKKPTDKNHVVKFNEYAVIYNGWAYLDPSGKYKRVEVPTNPTTFDNKIIKKYYRRPSQMNQDVVNKILTKLQKTHKDLQLEKPNN